MISNSECVYRVPPSVLKRRFEELEVAYRDVTQNLEKINNKHGAGDRSTKDGGDDARAVSSPDAPYTGNENDDSRRGASIMSHPNLPLSRWTTVSNDDELLNHLFTLFWTWETTITRILHREWLVNSLYARSATENGVSCLPEDIQEVQFCSELLINSILAISTVWLTFH